MSGRANMHHALMVAGIAISLVSKPAMLSGQFRHGISLVISHFKQEVPIGHESWRQLGQQSADQ
jgi:hypothetical protein